MTVGNRSECALSCDEECGREGRKTRGRARKKVELLRARSGVRSEAAQASASRERCLRRDGCLKSSDDACRIGKRVFCDNSVMTRKPSAPVNVRTAARRPCNQAISTRRKAPAREFWI